jgi:hypothetical protein
MDNKLITLVTRIPDPITRVSWDNYVTVSNADAKELGILMRYNGGLNGSYATITTKDGIKLENVPVSFNQVRQLVLLVLL